MRDARRLPAARGRRADGAHRAVAGAARHGRGDALAARARAHACAPAPRRQRLTAARRHPRGQDQGGDGRRPVGVLANVSHPLLVLD